HQFFSSENFKKLISDKIFIKDDFRNAKLLLHHAASAGAPFFIIYALDKGDPIEACAAPHYIHTPLSTAACLNHYATCALLLNKHTFSQSALNDALILTQKKEYEESRSGKNIIQQLKTAGAQEIVRFTSEGEQKFSLWESQMFNR